MSTIIHPISDDEKEDNEDHSMFMGGEFNEDYDPDEDTLSGMKHFSDD